MGANPNLTCCLDLWSSGRQVETENVEEAEMQSLMVNNVTNETCNLNVESTLPGEQSDAGMDHKCETIREMSMSQLEWTALHTASARAQQHSVQSLLEQGADVNAKDLFCRTPLDVAGLAHYYEGHKIDENNFMETVDLLLKAGGKFLKCRGQCFLDTSLHIAVELGSEAVVRQLLRVGASVTAWNRIGYTAMHMCVETRNEILLELLASHESSNEGSNLASIDVQNSWGRTVLSSAVHEGWIKGIDIVLGAGATNIQVPYIYKIIPGDAEYIPSTVIHLAANIGNADVLNHLLEFYYFQDKLKKYIDTFDMKGPPIYYAVNKNNTDCVKLLIDRGAKVNILIKDDILRDRQSPLLELAVSERNTKIAEMIMINDRETVHTFNSLGESPLYVACIMRDKKMIALLLQYGADLTGSENEKKLVPLERLMKTVSKATEFLKEIFDSNICSLPINKDAANVHFEIFVPRRDSKKMKVIQALLDTGNTYNQQDLLLHPLVESFLYLQWSSLLPFFYTILALHVFFVLSLNVFILSLFWYKDKKNDHVPIVFHSTAWICIIYLTAFVLTIQELITIKKKTIRYLLRLETAVKCLSTIFAFALPPVVLWDSTSNSDWVRLFGSVTLLLAGVRMMYLLSRLPDWGYYVLMYGKVAIKVFKILAMFGFLIFGFCVSFMIQFHAQPPFEDPLTSLLTTMVMMSSELGYNEIINKKNVEKASASLIMIRLIFASFLIFVSIILMNLLVAVAVNDVNTLENIGNLNRLKKQVQFIKSFEDTADNNFIKRIVPTCLYERWFKNKIPRYFAVQRYLPRKINFNLPTRLIEAICENLQLRKNQSEEKQDMIHETKLNESHESIVNKDNNVPVNPDIPANIMNQVLEEIIKLRTDVNQIKTRVDEYSRCSRCSNHRKVLLKNNDGHSSCPEFSI